MKAFKPEKKTESYEVEPESGPPAGTFVVRFWLEWSISGTRWRGHIEHLQSRQGSAFQSLEQMLAFMQTAGPIGDNRQRDDP